MAHETKFFSWEQLEGAKPIDQEIFRPIGNDLLSSALGMSTIGYPTITTWLSRAEKIYFGKIDNAIYAYWSEPSGYQTTNLPAFFQLSFKQRDKGIDRWGMSIIRLVVDQAYCVRLAGEILYGGKIWSNLIEGGNNKNKVYVEVEVDWSTSMVRVYLDDVRYSERQFRKLTSAQIGGFDTGSAELSGPAPDAVTSWCYPKGKSGGNLRVGNIYVSSWDGEGEDPGRLGPITCTPFNLSAIDQLNGSFKGYTSREAFLGRVLEIDDDNKGIVTNPGNEETVIAVGNIKSKVPATEELIAVSLSAGCSYNSMDLPVKFKSTVTKGSEELSNASKQARPSNGTRVDTKIPSFSTHLIPAEQFKGDDDVTLNISFKRLSDD